MEYKYLLYTFIFSKFDILEKHLYIILPFILLYFIIYEYDFIQGKINNFFCKKPLASVVLTSKQELDRTRRQTDRYIAVMEHLQNKNEPTILKMEEINSKGEYNKETCFFDIKDIFRIKQQKQFKIDNNIYGSIISRKETAGNGEYFNNIFVDEITIFSYKLSIKEIINFLDNLVNERNKRIIRDKLRYPVIIESSYDKKEKKMINDFYRWSSNVTFENRFFEDKDKIINQIDFFVNNPEYFKKKGIAHQLGILLHGVPGCGKTSFIKALANKTKRHIVSVKMTDCIDLKALKNLLFDEKIGNIPIDFDKRLYVFEDIDAMGELVNKRDEDDENDEDDDEDYENKDKKNKDKKNKKKINKSKDIKLFDIFTQKSSLDDKNNLNNNLSYLLNIFDGIQENNGRIIVMTTNHIEKLDPALIRPGRVDINIEFKKANKEITKQILQHYWEISEIEFSSNFKQLPHCEIVEKCRSSETLKETIEKLEDSWKSIS